MAEKIERKLAAILSADVVSYSRLMAADDERTRTALNLHRKELIDPVVAQHQGRVVGTAGDSILIEFASIIDAVQCAVALQRGMGERNTDIPEELRIVFRIGVNLGDVIVEGDDIHGDGVNVAARLEALSEPGGICISGEAFRQVRGKLDAGFADLGEQQVKNIPEPVRAYRVLLDPATAGQVIEQQRATKPERKWRWAIPAAAAVVVAIAAGVLLALEPWVPRVEQASIERMAFALPEKPSIAVLPFTNMSEDRAQEFFADGMTEDIITDLSKVLGLFVIARNTTFTYKGKAVKVRQVGEELGVRYVLEGSVRRQGGRVRINVQLIDATGGHHVWAERYDRDAEDIFAIQDEVAGEIVSALEVKLSVAEQAKLEQKPTDNLEAYDLYLLGNQTVDNLTLEGSRRSIEMFKLALDLDENFTLARVGLGKAYSNLLHYDLWRSDNNPDIDWVRTAVTN